MSIPFFKAVLKALGKRLNYEAAVNYAGNAFAKESGKIIEQANPLRGDSANVASGLLALFANVPITAEKDMQGMEWAND